jgi:hypothetical protein
MLVRSAALALAVLFGIAIVHKLRVLARGDGANEPLLQRSAVLARHSGPVLAAAASLEVAVAALLVLRPTWVSSPQSSSSGTRPRSAGWRPTSRATAGVAVHVVGLGDLRRALRAARVLVTLEALIAMW